MLYVLTAFEADDVPYLPHTPIALAAVVSTATVRRASVIGIGLDEWVVSAVPSSRFPHPTIDPAVPRVTILPRYSSRHGHEAAPVPVVIAADSASTDVIVPPPDAPGAPQ